MLDPQTPDDRSRAPQGAKSAPPDRCACSLLRKASRAVTQIYDAALRPSGLRATQLSLLASVGATEPVTIKRLAERTVMDRTTLTRNLQPLQREGLVAISPGRDRRERVVSLTERGHEIVSRSQPLWQEAERRVTQAVGVDRLGRLLGDLAATVEATWDD